MLITDSEFMIESGGYDFCDLLCLEVWNQEADTDATEFKKTVNELAVD